jgi:DNA gyrase subunit A
VRDGLKPVSPPLPDPEAGSPARKAAWSPGGPIANRAKIVGDVMGNYHPHGDSAIYDALARMAQDWSMRVPLIDGQGNFGSMDPDPPASMRYTEARLAKVANSLLDDLDKDTVDFADNYDGSRKEPTVLPARFPNLLVNGAGGIAVGMATNIPPHNLGEVIDGCLAYIENPAITIEELIEIIPGPDFPTAPLILGQAGARSPTHRARLDHPALPPRDRGRPRRSPLDRADLDPYPGRQVRPGRKDRRSRQGQADRGRFRHPRRIEPLGVRVVIDLKRDATPEVVLNQLWRHTPAQSSFPANMLAIRGGRPETLALRDIIQPSSAFREEVITRRTKFELNKARDRAHILLGLVIAVTNLDEVVKIIRGSSNPAAAREALLAREWPIGEIAPYIRLVEAIEANACEQAEAPIACPKRK